MGDRMKQMAAVLQAERLQLEEFNELGNAIAPINSASATTTRLPRPLKTVKRCGIYRKPISATWISFEPQSEFR